MSVNGDLAGFDYPAASIEHLKPVSHGGTDNLENLRLACLPCNSSRPEVQRGTFKPSSLPDAEIYGSHEVPVFLDSLPQVHERLRPVFEAEARRIIHREELARIDAANRLKMQVRAQRRARFTRGKGKNPSKDKKRAAELFKEKAKARESRRLARLVKYLP